MKKRIVCVLLTLIMLLSLVPITASAAGMEVSETAITILKQLEGYSTKCNSAGYTGYGTLCTEKAPHGNHKTNELKADEALRDKLEQLDKAVNSFASKKGISLTQAKHDALVLFSFENGTAWTTGTGDLQAAVASGKTGTDFLNAICRWDHNTADDDRRMIEANMYLNGVYSSSRPSSFIRVNYYPNAMGYPLPLPDANGDIEWEVFWGDINSNTNYQYYDVSNNPAPHLNPTMDYHTFTGWYIYDEYGWTKVSSLNAGHHKMDLVAGWTPNYSTPGSNYVNIVVYENQLLSTTLYKYDAKKNVFKEYTNKKGTNATDYYFTDEKALWVDSEYLDEDGVRWCRIEGTGTATSTDGYWVKVNYGGYTGSTSSGSHVYIDVTVTVTNSYVRSRVNADIHSNQNGTYNQGDQLRIINTEDADGFLWGQVAASATDDTPIGWVALVYTNFDAVRNEGNTVVNNSNAIATAVITYNGYVNVRSDAGTDNRIVSALAHATEVNLYETKFVNGLEWGRCSTGWFCLAYADVVRLTDSNSATSDIGFTSYVFTGTTTESEENSVEIYKEPSIYADQIFTRQAIGPEVTVSNLLNVDGITWGKIKEGWIQVTAADGTPIDVNLHTAKYVVAADSVTVRQGTAASEARVDTLTKGVEFNVNVNKQIVVAGDSVWGWADKVGEDNKTYGGWVNLANKYVTRNGAPTLENDDADPNTGKMATVVNTDNLKVRTTAVYGQQIGTLSRGATVAIWEEDDGWYKVDSNQNGTYDYDGDGWVSGTYLNIFEATESTTGTSSNNSATVETGLGVVANTYSGVNVRQGAGTGYAQTGKILPGTTVEILEVKTAGASKWGRVTQGWICMDYVTMINYYAVAGSTSTDGSSNANVTAAEDAIYTGTTTQEVNIRKEPSLTADIVHTIPGGSPVTMHKILTVTETINKDTVITGDDETITTTEEESTEVVSYWARVNDGYIYNPEQHITLDTLDEVTYTVTESDTLNVRSGAGTGYDKLYTLEKGDQVSVTRVKIVNGAVWGFVEEDAVTDYEIDEEGQESVERTWDGTGWISLKYTSKGAITVNTNDDNTNNNTNNNTTTPVTPSNPVIGNGSNTGGYVSNNSGYRYTGKIVNTNSVNVRGTPTLMQGDSNITTQIKNGGAVVIYETTIAEGMAWGRCDAGWIYLYYVDLTPVTGAVDARVVYNENTVIYTDMNCTAVAGTYAKMSVIDIYEIVGTMARTDKGWVSTNDLL